MINKQMLQFPLIYTSVINRMIIGWGAHETIADECKANNMKKVLITTTGLRGTGIVDEIDHILLTNGVETEIYNKVTTNVKDYQVMEAYEVFKNAGCDGVVSIGGGSSHDCGKGVRAVAANDGQYICDMACFIDPPWIEEKKKYKPVTIPQISVNTTAGTSAESTFVASVINTRVRAKHNIVLDGITPTLAIVDPLFVRLMPQYVAAWTGFDALSHGFESFLSRIRSPYTPALTLQMIKLISHNLREFVYNRMNNVACENMCWAANMSAAALHFGGGPGLVHGLSNHFSAVTDSHHGHTNASMTLPIERYNEPACFDRFAEMTKTMGVDTSCMTQIEASDRWFVEMERFLDDLNMQTGQLSKRFGLKKEDIKHIVEECANDFCQEGNPKDFNFDEAVQLLESMM